MGTPTPQELETALREAARMREQGVDEHYLAKAILNLHYRCGLLEKVLHAAENYLQSGMAEGEHTRLVKAIEQARAADDLGTHREHQTLGL